VENRWKGGQNVGRKGKRTGVEKKIITPKMEENTSPKKLKKLGFARRETRY
jgi:hypothetical protein